MHLAVVVPHLPKEVREESPPRLLPATWTLPGVGAPSLRHEVGMIQGREIAFPSLAWSTAGVGTEAVQATWERPWGEWLGHPLEEQDRGLNAVVGG